MSGFTVRKIGSAQKSDIQIRDEMLSKTDTLMMLPDYPYKDELAVYRQSLRDWTDSEDFPDTWPEVPKTKNGKDVL